MRTKPIMSIALMLLMLLLIACSSNNDVGEPAPTVGPLLGFSGVFADSEGESGSSRRGTTRGVGDGEFTNTELRASGFGVFCWYTGSADFTTATAATTMLMRNQKVTYDNTSAQWTYSPSKYWPLVETEKLTFRAYAPYVSYNLQTDVNGMPLLPVMVKADDYQNGTQHDPLWGTSKHGGSDGEETTYGELYNNYTYTMSGNSTDADVRDGVIDWYFHHGMSKLMFACSVIQNPGCSKVTIMSIQIENLYTQGLLSLSSETERNTDKPTWQQQAGDMTVNIGTEYLASNPFEINIADPSIVTGPVNLLEKGLLIIPRNFSSEGLKVTVTYSIDSDSTPLVAKGTIEQNFEGNTSYTLGLSLEPSTKGLEISLVQSAFTPWQEAGTGDHEVYNW